jgi:hypothetical protein
MKDWRRTPEIAADCIHDCSTATASDLDATLLADSQWRATEGLGNGWLGEVA